MSVRKDCKDKHQKKCRPIVLELINPVQTNPCVIPPVPTIIPTVAFRSTLTVAETLLAGAIQTIIFPVEQYDRQNGLPANNFDPVTSIFTAPLPGIYHFDVLVNVSPAVETAIGSVLVFLAVNGVGLATAGTSVVIPAIGSVPISCSTDLQLNAEDQVSVTGQNVSLGTIFITPGGVNGYFDGHYVSA